MVTHDVDEALLLSDQVVMLKNGPAATIGQVLDIPFKHPRSLEIRDSDKYHYLRQELMQFLQGQEMRGMKEMREMREIR
jgi:nitrate/nitrite transport system ATP-binding protein